MAKVTEGYVPFGEFRTYWRMVGEKTDKTPLLVVHGGPGASHDYLTTLDDLAEGGRQVIYYDQCGCGRSASDRGPASWSLDFFAEELRAVHRHLSLGRFHLLGHSWGGMLAIRFAHGRPKELSGLVLASSPVSVEQWNREIYRLLSEMPPEQRRVLEEGEMYGVPDTREYRDALALFVRRHICRMETIPIFVLRSLSQMGKNAVKAGNRLTLGGPMKELDLTPLLADIDVPALIIAGKFGKCTSKVMRTLLDGIAGSRSVVLEKSAHLPHVEERKIFNEAVETFLMEAEAGKANRP